MNDQHQDLGPQGTPARPAGSGAAGPPSSTETVTADDLRYQRDILQGVSRTFALTIPTLPDQLCLSVGNAYLLCRLADTIEDEPALSAAQKRALSEQFIDVVAGATEPDRFATELLPLLSGATLDAERDLVANTARVIRITRSLMPGQRRALERCVRIMGAGMAEFQEKETLDGLADQREMDRYCYYVAGVVGEMLTDLFCEHSPDIARHRETLQALAVSFGQALQMTNILKDIWDDRSRGACWLPREVFLRAGFSLGELTPGAGTPEFQRGLLELVSVAAGHLHNALRYTLTIPPAHAGIRRFCLWALGMAVLTLRKIRRRPDFASGAEVKITRRTVHATVAVTSAFARVDFVLEALFAVAVGGLMQPATRSGEAGPDAARQYAREPIEGSSPEPLYAAGHGPANAREPQENAQP
ncbi:MAG: phytoene/squalene synthase family protein [Gammaproteobacteria bacterium]